MNLWIYTYLQTHLGLFLQPLLFVVHSEEPGYKPYCDIDHINQKYSKDSKSWHRNLYKATFRIKSCEEIYFKAILLILPFNNLVDLISLT